MGDISTSPLFSRALHGIVGHFIISSDLDYGDIEPRTAGVWGVNKYTVARGVLFIRLHTQTLECIADRPAPETDARR